MIRMCLLLMSIPFMHFKQQQVEIEVYCGPREYSCTFFMDNGIRNYRLDRTSIYASRSRACFSFTDHGRDTIVVMAYLKKSLDKPSLDKMLQFDPIGFDNSRLTPRALLVIHKNKRSDTLFINSDFTARQNGRQGKVSSELKSFLVNVLPSELRGNWECPGCIKIRKNKKS